LTDLHPVPDSARIDIARHRSRAEENMVQPSPFFDPQAPSSDLDEFLGEVDAALDGFVPAELEHLVLHRETRDEVRAA
jgi:hypothetical protein